MTTPTSGHPSAGARLSAGLPVPALLTVVVPCFNEEQVIRETHARLCRVLGSLDIAYEIVYVDDGSQDATAAILNELAVLHTSVRVLQLARNFGHQVAVTAGIDHANGDAVVLIDADLQDPPEVITDLLRLWREGYQVVYGVRAQRAGESPFKRWTAAAFYRLINRMSDVPIPLDTGDFRLMDRCVVDVLRQMPERHRFVRGMVSWVGFRQVPFIYDRQPRFAGESKYPLRKMLRFALDGVTSFSTVPLRWATWCGLAASVIALLGVVYAVVDRLFTKDWVPGWAALFVAILFVGGVQLLSLGAIGEYVGRIYGEAKARPLYVVATRSGFGAREAAVSGSIRERHQNGSVPGDVGSYLPADWASRRAAVGTRARADDGTTSPLG